MLSVLISFCYPSLWRRRFVNCETITSISENNVLWMVVSFFFFANSLLAKCTSVTCHSIPGVYHYSVIPLILSSVLICGVPEVLHLDVGPLVSGVSNHLFILSLWWEWLHSVVDSEVNGTRFINIPMSVRRNYCSIDSLVSIVSLLVSNLNLLVHWRYLLLSVSKNRHKRGFLRRIIVQVHSTGQVSHVSKLRSTSDSIVFQVRWANVRSFAHSSVFWFS